MCRYIHVTICPSWYVVYVVKEVGSLNQLMGVACNRMHTQALQSTDQQEKPDGQRL